MKVLFISVFRDNTGYSHGAQEYALALDAAGIDVVCRSIALNNSNAKCHPRVEELLQKSDEGCDYCIQYILPHLFDFQRLNFKKVVGLFATETSNFVSSSWGERCNMMDEIWTINTESKAACLNSGVKVPVRCVGHPIDIAKCSSDGPKLDVPQVNDTFVFYTIGEFTRRKNFTALLQAFHSEFDLDEPVSLIIKTSGDRDNILQAIQQVKAGMKLYANNGCRKDIVITSYLKEEDMASLHRLGNAYVCTSYGEAWSIPAFESVAYGNYLLAPDYGPFRDVFRNYNLIECNSEPCFGMIETFGDLYTGREDWWHINVRDLQRYMREVYSGDFEVSRDTMRANIENFSHEKIGLRMKAALETTS